jgi:predicted chitinase
MLSTVRVESYQYREKLFFKPVSENISYSQAEIDYGSGATASDANRARLNHNLELGDGYKYRGRGLVQLTWKINYEKFSRVIGVDLSGNPDLACELPAAVKIMMLGMRDGEFRAGHNLEKYLGKGRSDYYNARLIINGYRSGIPDKANEFEAYARAFEEILNEIE